MHRRAQKEGDRNRLIYQSYAVRLEKKKLKDAKC